MHKYKAAKLVGALVVALGSSLASPTGLANTSSNSTPKVENTATASASADSNPIQYSERQLRLRLYPCQDCHRLADGAYERKGKYHYNIDYNHFDNAAIGLGAPVAQTDRVAAPLGEHHSPTCLVCHDSENRDQLRLPTSVGGATVSFNESYKQCLSCHGDKQADYYAGIHGKDVGGYSLKSKAKGKLSSQRYQQIRLQCVDCHNPHSPRRPQVTPLPPPKKPRTLIPKGGH